MSNSLMQFIRKLYAGDEQILLHAPHFAGNEKKYLNECIDTTMVSYVGAFVTRFEQMVCEFTGVQYAVAMANGTIALQIALQASGVKAGDLVITQALTFVATANAIRHAGAEPAFLDSDTESLGLDPEALIRFITKETTLVNGVRIHTASGRRVSACVPVHIFGHPCQIQRIADICAQSGIVLVEDAAESLGSYVGDRHTGTWGLASALSFNGNKTVTTGGGGMLLTNDANLAKFAKHITTTAKVPHPYEFMHDQVAYNFRMPNVNAAIGCAQMEQLPQILANKRETAQRYQEFCSKAEIPFLQEPQGTRSNYWLCAVLLPNLEARNAFLEETNAAKVQTRPVWKLMTELPMYANSPCDELANAKSIAMRLVNIPSGVRT